MSDELEFFEPLSADAEELYNALLDTITGDDEIDSLLLSAANRVAEDHSSLDDTWVC